MKFMNSVKKKKIILSIVIALIITLAASGICIRQINKTITNSIMLSMKEIAEHDSKSINSGIEALWDELGDIYTRIRTSKPDNIQDVYSLLNVEQNSKNYDIICLLADDGKTYSAVNSLIELNNETYIQRLLNGEQKIAVSYNSRSHLKKDYILYAALCKPFNAGDITFIGIIGLSDSKLLEQRFKTDCFDGLGYTKVIDTDGNYVINTNKTDDNAKNNNFYSDIKMKSGYSDDKINIIKKQIASGNCFFDKAICKIHKKEIFYYFPVNNKTWGLVFTVPQGVITEKLFGFIIPAIIMLLFIIIVPLITVCYIMRLIIKSSTVNSSANFTENFISQMGHKLRTPLNTLIGLNHLMQQNIGNIHKMDEYLKKSSMTTKSLMVLINDILDISKLQIGKMEIEPKLFSIKYMLSVIKSILADSIEDKNIEFIIKTNIISDTIIGDEMRIEQILMNILSNAVKFTGEGGHISFKISQTLSEIGMVETVYEIKDDGCGMSDEYQKRIFDAFSQEKESSNISGTGLGMSICLLLCEQMGGTLSVSSKQNIGSCFTFTITNKISEIIPNEEEKPNTISKNNIVKPPEQTEVTSVTAKNINILIAEDNKLNLEILTELLEAEGFHSDGAADGKQVVDMFECSEPYTYDLILMDVQMPIYNGYEATRIIRSMKRPDAKSVIIYACTANTFNEDRNMAVDSGMNDFISKPVDINKLLEKLNENSNKETPQS